MPTVDYMLCVWDGESLSHDKFDFDIHFHLSLSLLPMNSHDTTE